MSAKTLPSAGGGEPEAAAAEREALLVFRVAGIWLAVPAVSVLEIVDDRSPNPLPMAPPHLPGVVLVRGEVVALLALDRFLGLAAEGSRGEEEGFRRIVLVEAGGLRAGIRSEKIRGVRSVLRSEQVRPEAFATGTLGEYVDAQVDLENLGLAAVLGLERLLASARRTGR